MNTKKILGSLCSVAMLITLNVQAGDTAPKAPSLSEQMQEAKTDFADWKPGTFECTILDASGVPYPEQERKVVMVVDRAGDKYSIKAKAGKEDMNLILSQTPQGLVIEGPSGEHMVARRTSTDGLIMETSVNDFGIVDAIPSVTFKGHWAIGFSVCARQ